MTYLVGDFISPVPLNYLELSSIFIRALFAFLADLGMILVDFYLSKGLYKTSNFVFSSGFTFIIGKSNSYSSTFSGSASGSLKNSSVAITSYYKSKGFICSAWALSISSWVMIPACFMKVWSSWYIALNSFLIWSKPSENSGVARPCSLLASLSAFCFALRILCMSRRCLRLTLACFYL